MRSHWLVSALLVLPGSLCAQNHGPHAALRYADSSGVSSTLTRIGAGDPGPCFRVRGGPGRLEGRWTYDTSLGCSRATSIRHSLKADTLDLVLLRPEFLVCFGMVSFETFAVQTAPLRPGAYHIRVWEARIDDARGLTSRRALYEGNIDVP